jgi:hypothetical protein
MLSQGGCQSACFAFDESQLRRLSGGLAYVHHRDLSIMRPHETYARPLPMAAHALPEVSG